MVRHGYSWRMGCGTSTLESREESRPRTPQDPKYNINRRSSRLENTTQLDKQQSVQNGILDQRKKLQPRDSLYFTQDLFFDPDFMPELQVTRDGYFEQLDWKRPYTIVKQPEMFIAGSTPGDINQGLLGDCWFLSACAAVSINDDLINRIIPGHQVLDGPGYTGNVNFRFWQYGQWINVEIDDLLPTVDSKLIFAHSSDEREFWVPLIEKAYAKLHGSYDALEGGRAMDAFVDLTGGLSERHELIESNLDVYRAMGEIRRNGGVIACSRTGKWQTGEQSVDEYGLVSGHAYTVSDVQTITHAHGEEHLVKVRNPWGDGTEWKGAWSDGDACWDWVSEDDIEKLQVANEEDGEFWMSFDDFCHHFSEVTTCTSGEEDCVKIVRGEWIKGINAGGCRNSMEDFATNPQFSIEICTDYGSRCELHIALMQHPLDRRELHQIGFILYESKSVLYLSYDLLCRMEEVGKSGVYINHREVNARFHLPSGKYILIPSTFNAHDESKFLIRISANNGTATIKAITNEIVIES